MVYRRMLVLLMPLVPLALLPGGALCQHHAVRTMSSDAGTQSSPSPLAPADAAVPLTGLNSQIAVDLDGATFVQALQSIAEQAAVRISVTDGATRTTKRVTLRAKKMRAADAFQKVLAGTNVHMTVAHDGQVLFSVAPGSIGTQQGQGTVMGRVTDIATKRPLSGATVTIEGLKRSARTNDSGQYVMSRVQSGSYRMAVRVIGYAATSRAITVGDGDTLIVNVPLSSVPQRLQEVVTVGSGDRRKLEVGNSIATINADSVVQRTPIRNLSDLLKGRAPGVDVMSTSGDVGAGSRIRIRGVASIMANTDPIVIVDGVRIDAAYSQSATSPTLPPSRNTAGYGNDVPSMSRLNDIDHENIETIEVLRGPSAATLYGSDAANGVIVITTKRGHAGPTQWSVFAQHTTMHMDAKFMDDYRAWGHSDLDPTVTECRPMDAATGRCTLDSVSRFNPLNNPATTPFAGGSSTQYGAQMSGGTQQLQYFVGANYNDDVGMLKLPAADIANLLIFRSGAPLPDYAIRPNIMNGFHVTSKLTTQTAKSDLAISTDVVHQYHRDSPNDFITYSYQGTGYLDPVTNGWGTFTPARFFLTKTSDEISRGFGGVSGSWRPWSMLSTRGTIGIDYTDRTDVQLQRKGDQPFDLSGYRYQNDQNTLVRTGDVGATYDLGVRNGARLRSAFGGQYVRTDISGLQTSGQGLADGVDIVNNATTRDASQVNSAQSTAGWYDEETIMLSDRLFLTGAVRGDAGSGFGADAKAVLYPKWNASWLLSQEPFFRHVPAVNNLRVRAAFGHAGVQPTIDARFRSFKSINGFTGGSTPAIGIATIGNSQLVPERSVETEGGFDLGLWNDRATIEATMYQKTTRNALVMRSLPPSLGVSQRQENIGKVDNRGLELTATVRPIVTRMLDWNMTVGYSQNRNKLVTLGPTTIPQTDFYEGGSARYVPGYPLNGFWDRVILAYADTNHNGVIEAGEYKLSDSAVYMGQPFPKEEISIANDLGLFSGLIRIGSTFTFTGGLTQRNTAALSQCDIFALRCQAANDPNASLRQQAIGLASYYNVYNYSAQGYYERASWLRLNEISVSFLLPTSMAHRLRARTASIAIMGRNFGLWSNYTGADPEVNTNNSANNMDDEGGVPQPREWTLRVNLGL